MFLFFLQCKLQIIDDLNECVPESAFYPLQKLGRSSYRWLSDNIMDFAITRRAFNGLSSLVNKTVLNVAKVAMVVLSTTSMVYTRYVYIPVQVDELC